MNQQEKQVFLRKALVITQRRNIQFTTGLLGNIANLQELLNPKPCLQDGNQSSLKKVSNFSNDVQVNEIQIQQKLSTSCKLNATGPFLDFKRTNMHTGQPIEQSLILV